jgi:hypothetical protein
MFKVKDCGLYTTDAHRNALPHAKLRQHVLFRHKHMCSIKSFPCVTVAYIAHTIDVTVCTNATHLIMHVGVRFKWLVLITWRFPRRTEKHIGVLRLVGSKATRPPRQWLRFEWNEKVILSMFFTCRAPRSSAGSMSRHVFGMRYPSLQTQIKTWHQFLGFKNGPKTRDAYWHIQCVPGGALVFERRFGTPRRHQIQNPKPCSSQSDDHTLCE